MKRDTLLYVPHGGSVRAEFMVSAFNALAAPGSPIAELREMHCGPVMGMARNAITEDFLQLPHEWLLMVDSDMKFTPGTVRLLRASADPVERPVVGALCMTIADGGRITTMYRADVSDKLGFGFTSYTLDEVPASALMKVDGTGAACLLLHRSAFSRMADANPDHDHLWWAELAIGKRLLGEDFSFCVRCREAGLPVFVHTGARTGHVKAVILGEAGP